MVYYSSFSGHGSEFLASPGNQQWLGPCQRNSPKQAMNKSLLINQDQFQNLIPAKSNIQSPGVSPPRLARMPSHCAIPNDPINGHQRPRSLVQVPTPTTPAQNPAVSFQFADAVSPANNFATPSPTNSRHPPTPQDQRFQNDVNALHKLQQLANDVESESLPGIRTGQRKTSLQGQTSYSPSCGTRRQRYKSTGVPERPSSVQQSLISNVNSPYQASITPPERTLAVHTQQHYADYSAGIQLNPSASFSNDTTIQKSSFGSNVQGMPSASAASDCAWPAYPPHLSRQQSAPPYSHFTGSVHEQAHTGLHHYPQYGASGVNFSNDRTPNAFNQVNCAFPPGLPVAYQHQHLMSGNPRDYPTAEMYRQHGDMGPQRHLSQGEGTIPPMFNSTQALGAYQQPAHAYYNQYSGMYR